MWNVEKISARQMRAECYAGDILHMKPYLRKTHTRLKVEKRCGFFTVKKIIKKLTLLWIWLTILLALYIFWNSRIWDIRISGNNRLSDSLICDFLETREISPGSHKQDNYSDIEADMLENFDDIVWCNIYTEGDCIVVEISEAINN